MSIEFLVPTEQLWRFFFVQKKFVLEKKYCESQGFRKIQI